MKVLLPVGCLYHSNPTWIRKVSLSDIKYVVTDPPLLSNPQKPVEPDSVI